MSNEIIEMDTEPEACITCRSTDCLGMALDSECNEVWREVDCQNCGTHWEEIYRFVGITNIVTKQTAHEN